MARNHIGHILGPTEVSSCVASEDTRIGHGLLIAFKLAILFRALESIFECQNDSIVKQICTSQEHWSYNYGDKRDLKLS